MTAPQLFSRKEPPEMMRKLQKPPYSFLLFTIVIGLIQGISLFRSYPLNPACGRVIKLMHNANVLINCDSAIFMKDAQNPLRLLEGQSVYQDRPFHAILVWIIGSILKISGFPNEIREIVGNAGKSTPYESVFYLSYLGLNLAIILVATIIGIRFVFENKISDVFKNGFLLPAIVVLVINANELTKSFFWTPHSQMFNILFPTLALALISKKTEIDSLRAVLLVSSLIVVLMFFYPLFGILFAILFFCNYSNFLGRASAIVPFISAYIFYPKILGLLGGNYSNYAVGKYRQYIWIYDSIKRGSLFENTLTNLNLYSSTFPIIPIFVMVVCTALIFFVVNRNADISISFSVLLPYLYFFIFYLATLSMMGYYSRRLTLGALIFLELAVIKLGIKLWTSQLSKTKQTILISVVFVLVGSWIWTNGPLA